jgi:hypothetical protein
VITVYVVAESCLHVDDICMFIHCICSLDLSPLRERIAQAKTLSTDSNSDSSTTSATQQ